MGKGSHSKTRVVLMGLSDSHSRNSSLKGNLFYLIAESMQKKMSRYFYEVELKTSDKENMIAPRDTTSW